MAAPGRPVSFRFAREQGRPRAAILHLNQQLCQFADDNSAENVFRSSRQKRAASD